MAQDRNLLLNIKLKRLNMFYFINKHILLVLICSLPFSQLFSQQEKGMILDSSNMRFGEEVEFCRTHLNMKGIKRSENIHFTTNNYKSASSNEKNVIYTIPVVFHVIHNNGIENIGSSQIMDALRVMNEGFRSQNADINTVQLPFQGLQADAEIEFKLATIAPNGQCFSGITRTVSPITNAGATAQEMVDAVISGNDVYQGLWPHTKYLNIIIAANIGGAAGYTWNPFTDNTVNNVNMAFNSVYILPTYVGAIGISNASKSTSLTHEVGHWLNLAHPWGNSNSPGNPLNCDIDDGVQDTPMCIGVISCDLNSNSCNDLNDPNDFSSWSTDVIDNVENFMDYSFCSKMFTAGQVEVMRSCIANGLSGRDQICSSSNLLAVGVTSSPALCKADFMASNYLVCIGDTVHFTDLSYHFCNSWNWSFEGATVSVATQQNPSIVWNNPGTYNVKLIVSDGFEIDSAFAVIQVVPVTASLTYFESFENINSFLASTDWFIENASGNTWVVTNTASNSGTNCAMIENFGEQLNLFDNLFSSGIDLSSVPSSSGATFSFRYAYRKRLGSNNDVLRVFFSKNCGKTWELRKTYNASTMSGPFTEDTFWSPNASDWITTHILNLTNEYWTDGFRYKFEFKSGGGNNIYIDDINIYPGPPSETIVGVSDLEKQMQNIHVYPNPAEEELNLFFVATTFFEGSVSICDFSGRKLQYQDLNVNGGSNSFSINTSNLSAGFYFVNLTNHQSGAVFQQPFMVK
jgi:PKD repeat protein